jgi:N-acyl-D-amino-acid deacylase
MLDIIIKNCEIYDGKGDASFPADIGIQEDRIVKIGRLSSGEGRRVIDAQGLAVAPGFIDIHSHEFTVLNDPPPDSKILQGITTEVMGNCGISLAPVSGEGKVKVKEQLGIYKEYTGDLNWSSLGECLSFLETRGLTTNYIPLVGHGTIRASVMGTENKAPDAEQLKEMKARVARSMEEGARGLSTGLIYPPALFAGTEELIELAKEAARFKGIYASHIRGEHDGVLQPAIEEAIRIGREAGLPVEISHLKLFGRKLWGQADSILKMIELAGGDGLDVTADAYPYTATHTTLKTILPAWVHEGGIRRMVERLKDPSLRKRMREEMERGEVIYFKDVGWEGVMIVKSGRDGSMDGKNIAGISELRRKDPYEVVFDILSEEPGIRANYFALDEEDVSKILKHPLVMIGSDSYALSNSGNLGQGKPHPRTFGTFPRILGKYVREEKLLSLEQGIRKMSFFPALKLGLKDRGRIEEGTFADLVLFDPKRIAGLADFAEPQQYPEGIEIVLLNGEVVVEKGEHTGKPAGRVLRHQ